MDNKIIHRSYTEHYLEAERLIQRARDASREFNSQGLEDKFVNNFNERLALRLSMAQVHATLAQCDDLAVAEDHATLADSWEGRGDFYSLLGFNPDDFKGPND